MPPNANIGIQISTAFIGRMPERRELADFFQAAEALRFHSLWAMERILHEEAAVLHPLTTLAWAAGVTSRIKIGTAVVLATLRHPLLLAKAAVTLDYISQGRFILGISLGGRPADFAALGIPMRQRVRRLEETIHLLRQLWTGTEVSFHGRHFDVEGVTLAPRPTTPGGIPILLGGDAEPVLRRTATLADGWIAGPLGTWSAEQFQERWQKLRQFAREAGRDPERLDPTMVVYFAVDDTAEKARQRIGEHVSSYYGSRFDADKCVFGTPDDCARKLQGFLDAGVKTLILSLSGPSIQELERIQREVLPLLR